MHRSRICSEVCSLRPAQGLGHRLFYFTSLFHSPHLLGRSSQSVRERQLRLPLTSFIPSHALQQESVSLFCKGSERDQFRLHRLYSFHCRPTVYQRLVYGLRSLPKTKQTVLVMKCTIQQQGRKASTSFVTKVKDILRQMLCCTNTIGKNLQWSGDNKVQIKHVRGKGRRDGMERAIF